MSAVLDAAPKVEDVTILAFSYWPAELEMRLTQRFIDNKPVNYRLSVTSAVGNVAMFGGAEQDFGTDYLKARDAFTQRVKEIL